MASTLPGMSGSCCINVHGIPIALHEVHSHREIRLGRHRHEHRRQSRRLPVGYTTAIRANGPTRSWRDPAHRLRHSSMNRWYVMGKRRRG